jgi:hypothetical protein
MRSPILQYMFFMKSNDRDRGNIHSSDPSQRSRVLFTFRAPTVTKMISLRSYPYIYGTTQSHIWLLIVVFAFFY